MTFARTSQVVAEVLRTNTDARAQVSQVVAEVLRINTGTVIRTSQLAVEVVRPNDDELTGDGVLRYVIAT
jgi:hypothetical protein